MLSFVPDTCSLYTSHVQTQQVSVTAAVTLLAAYMPAPASQHLLNQQQAVSLAASPALYAAAVDQVQLYATAAPVAAVLVAALHGLAFAADLSAAAVDVCSPALCARHLCAAVCYADALQLLPVPAAALIGLLLLVPAVE